MEKSANLLKELTRIKFLFDLNGFAVIRNVLSKEELIEANKGIDAHAYHERKDQLRNTESGTLFSGDEKTGRLDMGGMLGWEEPYRNVFRKFLNHPNLVPYLHLLVGEGYRLDHSPLIIGQMKGSEGFSLHGGSIDIDGTFTTDIQYVCKNNQIWNSLLAASFFLQDQNAGDGGFCVVPGSHKINFPPIKEMMEGRDADFLNYCCIQPACKAGDVVLFSEGTIHGCLPWNADHQRRIALYRFAPNHCQYARLAAEQWPASFLDGMTEAQKAVMLPAYNQRYDRPYLGDNGEIKGIKQRSEIKKEFDQEVFGTKYH